MQDGVRIAQTLWSAHEMNATARRVGSCRVPYVGQALRRGRSGRSRKRSVGAKPPGIPLAGWRSIERPGDRVRAPARIERAFIRHAEWQRRRADSRDGRRELARRLDDEMRAVGVGDLRERRSPDAAPVAVPA
jgi:hypothetical protein